jgi:hypothetical protein
MEPTDIAALLLGDGKGEAVMSTLDKVGSVRPHGAALHLMAMDPGVHGSPHATRLDEVWSPVVRRSGLVAGSLSLLLIGVGIVLLDMAMNRYALMLFTDLLH